MRPRFAAGSRIHFVWTALIIATAASRPPIAAVDVTAIVSVTGGQIRGELLQGGGALLGIADDADARALYQCGR